METNWNEKLQKAASFGIVILGNILYALAVRLFDAGGASYGRNDGNRSGIKPRVWDPGVLLCAGI